MSTIVNPSIPFSSPIPGGLTVGKMILVQAKVPRHHNSFSINLCVGPNIEPLTETGLHFNPRFNEGCIVRNSLEKGSWATEERQGGLPLKKGTPFEIIMMVNHKCYKISINGKHFTNFTHRIPKESLTYLVISGGVEVSFIKFEGGQAPPPYSPPVQGVMPLGLSNVVPLDPLRSAPQMPMPAVLAVGNPPVPYLTQIPGSLFPGRMIFISGIPFPNPSRFTVNLQCGPLDMNDVGLHFDARFNFGDSKYVVVRNHKQANTWGTEERHASYFPFAPQTMFDMIILIQPTSIKIAVNNQHFCEFYHRIQPLNTVNWLSITGDVQLTSVRIQ